MPAKVDIDVSWEAIEPSQDLGAGDAVGPTDPAAFSGRFAQATAVGSFAGEILGFSFWGDATTDVGWSELGTERNGAFL